MCLLFREHGKIYLGSSSEFVEGEGERERERGTGGEREREEGEEDKLTVCRVHPKLCRQYVHYTHYLSSGAGQSITESNTINCAGASRGQLQKFRNSI
jgi:hypothetical protein